MSEEEPPQIAGYVRCGVTHAGCDWNFEVLSERPRVAIVTITTNDGLIDIGLNRADAEGLVRTLQLFLAEWPEDQASS
jgi:hypothetical protein